MSKAQSNKFEVLKPLRHDGERVFEGAIITIEHEFTAATLMARGYIRKFSAKNPPIEPPKDPEGEKAPEPGTPGAPVTPDPAMVPAAMKENDPGSEKVNTSGDAQ